MKNYQIPAFTLIVIVLLSGCINSSGDSSSEKFAADSLTITQGAELFEQHCSACHNFRQRGIGPNLAGVTRQEDPDWLAAFITNSPQMVSAGDARAVSLLAEYKIPMPPFPFLTEGDISRLLAYMHTFAAAETAVIKGDTLGDPIADSIVSSGIHLVVEPFVQVPPSAAEPPQARINKMLPMPGTDRLFIHDLRGKLYEIMGDSVRTFLDMAVLRKNFIEKPGLGTGLGSFAFHPDFTSNGLFYTTHTEPPQTAPADFAFEDSLRVTLQWVLTEWKQANPSSPHFSGTGRELMRVNMVTGIHGFQDLNFNPLAKKGDPEYGLLYLGIGDGGSTGEGYWFVCHDKRRIWGSVIRINPAGNNSRNGKYGIPPDNPFAKDPDPQVVKEIFIYGFRNPHRSTWDMDNGKMYVTDIGQANIEELNLAVAGGDYGWSEREGTFRIADHIEIGDLYPLPEGDESRNFIYPVLQFDHDEGSAISGGYVYRGKKMPLLQGKYIFGDVVSGRLMMANADELQNGKQAPIFELELEVNEKSQNLESLTGNKRVDLRFGQDQYGELYIFTKADGKIWKVVNSRK
ncbi:MAG: PQQ-dependent sugar dehydrogenase [Bacteroidia bacterium]|nr:PQQ-dependent sugar dehydrogenase [Bacteroidia bacterium]